MNPQAQDPSPQHTPSRTLTPIFLGILAGVIFLGALIIILSTAYRTKSAYRIVPNVSIGGISVGGLTTTQASERINLALTTMINEGLSVRFGNEQHLIPLTPKGATDPDLVYELITSDVSSAVEEAYRIGRKGDGSLTFFGPLFHAWSPQKNLRPSIGFAQYRILDELRASFPLLETTGSPTMFSFDEETGKATIIPAQAGNVISTEVFFTNLSEDAQDFVLTVQDIPLTPHIPEVTEEEAESLLSLAEKAYEKAPYTLTYTQDSGETVTFLLEKSDLKHAIIPGKSDEGELVLEALYEELSPWISSLHEDLDIAPQNATFAIENDRVTTFVPSRDGIIVDDAKLLNTLSEAFMSTEQKKLSISVTTKAPEVPIENVNDYGIKEVLGVGYSSFAGSPSNRRVNIRNGAAKLNGLLIPPGETLSLLEKLKPFTTESGYLPELVIKGDSITPEIGGGLCQIGTTTFRAAMNSGLNIVERRNHSLVVSYYNDPSNGEPGTDATIYDPAPDLKIQNDTEHYIMLITDINESTSELHFTFWGTSDGRKGSYTPPTVLSWIGYGDKVTKTSSSLAPGVTKCQAAHPGATTTFDYLVTRADGTTTTKTFTSSYRPLPEICLVGESTPAPEEPVTTEATAEPTPIVVE